MLTSNTTHTPGSGHTWFRELEPADGPEIWALVEVLGLDLNSVYAYVLWGDHFSDTSIVAVHDDVIVGVVIGFRIPREPSTLFIWQIGVNQAAQGTGLASRMLDELVARTGVSMVEATVTPSNAASTALFRRLGARHDGEVTETLGYGEELFPPGHEAEIRFRIEVAGNQPHP